MASETRSNRDPRASQSKSSCGVEPVSPILKPSPLGARNNAGSRTASHRLAPSQPKSSPKTELQPRPKGFVYFVGADTGPIKVGWSKHPPERRVETLQTGNPDLLYVWGCVEGPQGIEQSFHQTLSRHRLRGEWFDRDAALDLLADHWVEGTLTADDETELALAELDAVLKEGGA